MSDRAALASALRALADVLDREAKDARCLTVAAVAERLAVGESTVRRLIKSGQLPAQVVGDEGVRVQDVDLQAYIDRGRELGALKWRRRRRAAA